MKPSKIRREFNRKQAPSVLQSEGIKHLTCNGGTHLVLLQYNNQDIPRIDFWPGTGKWIEKDTGLVGQGLKSLLNYVQRGEL